jgi:ankyrin repeat protein
VSVIEAIVAGDVERVRELVRDDPAAAAARDEQGVSALLQAKYNGREELVPVLWNAAGELDFFEACAVGDVARVEELLEHDPTLVRAIAADGFFGLTLAAFFGQPEIVRVLIDRGADVDRRAEHEQIRVTPIHAASAGNHTEIVRMLLEAGADVNATQPGGFTALMAAAQNGNAEMAELLLERGADASAATDGGRTAATFAADAGHAALAERLATA